MNMQKMSLLLSSRAFKCVALRFFVDPIYQRLQNIRQAYQRLVDPILVAIRRELGAIIAKLHRIDLSKPADPMAGMSGASFYMKDLVDKLSFIKTEILSKFNVGEAGREWSVAFSSSCVLPLRPAKGHLNCQVRHPDVRSPCIHCQTSRREWKVAADERYDRARIRAECVFGGERTKQAGW
jgi:hypothetical protein